MSQNPLAFSNSQPSERSTSNLKPQLAAALASLEVQLEQELARYRRTRPTAMRKPVLGSYSLETQPSPIIPEPATSTPQEIKTETEVPPQASTFDTNHQDSQLPVTETPEASVTNSLPSPSITEDGTREHTFPENTRHNNPEIDKYEESGNQENQSSQTDSISEAQASNHELRSPAGSIVPAITSGTPPADVQPNTPNHSQPSTSEPDDYLESSEALLRSLTEPESPQKSPQSSNNNSLLSPLGIGSMLLLLVASAILGIVLFRPQLIPRLSLGGLLEDSPANNNAQNNSPDSPITDNPSPSEPEITPGPIVPNLANEEFPEVKNPNDVVGLTPQPSPTPTNPIPSANIQTNIPPNPNPPQTAPTSTTNLPPVNPPAPVATSPARPQVVNDADFKRSANGLYQLVIENQGEETFNNARQAVPDAYLSPDKKYIFVGAVSSKEGAKKLLKELEAKGVNARPYQP